MPGPILNLAGSSGRRTAAVALAVGALGLSGCGAGGTELSEGASPAKIEAGRSAYERSCAACHGVGGVGTEQGPPFLHEVYEPSHHADGAFVLAVRNGVRAHHWTFGDMPRQEGVSDAEIATIVAYVRAIQRDAGIE
jgi:mono/diheme cytochrome c family protein